MKRVLFLFIYVVVTEFSMPAKAQIASGYEVATWYNFRTSAVTYTFDDNLTNQLSVALPLFDKYDYKVTFFVITSRITNWNGYIAATNNGHEVTSHTVSHSNLSTLTVANQEIELKNSQTAIKTNVKFSECLTTAYPFCAIGDLNTVRKYYIAGRTCDGTIVPSTPTDFFRISSIVTGTTSFVQTSQQFNDKANLAKTSKGWCVFLMHAIDGESGYSPTQSSELADHLSYINTNITDFWVATFENVVKYIKERDALIVSEEQTNFSSYKINVTDNLPDSVYNVPVTIKRVLPSNWSNAKIYQNNELISSSIVTNGDNKYIVFDVTPDCGDLILEIIDETGAVEVLEGIIKIAPNPFTNEICVYTYGQFKYSIFKLDGSILEQGTGNKQKGIGINLSSGAYILRVEVDNQVSNIKFIKI